MSVRGPVYTGLGDCIRRTWNEGMVMFTTLALEKRGGGDHLVPSLCFISNEVLMRKGLHPGQESYCLVIVQLGIEARPAGSHRMEVGRLHAFHDQ